MSTVADAAETAAGTGRGGSRGGGGGARRPGEEGARRRRRLAACGVAAAALGQSGGGGGSWWPHLVGMADRGRGGLGRVGQSGAGDRSREGGRGD